MSVDKILGQLLGSPAKQGFAGGLAGGLASGLLTSKAGRKLGKQALKLGGVAAIGGVAYAAWNRHRAGAEGGASPSFASLEPPVLVREAQVTGFLPAGDRPAEQEALGLVLLRSMIAAAHADGKLDDAERRTIFGRVAEAELSADDQALLWREVEHPASLQTLVAAATTRERAVEIYTAALLAIEVDTPAERGYLRMLAAGLDLPDDVVAAVHAEIEAPERAPAVTAA
jgi:uncharacterized membrane protein YebE (DUF533 family)